MTIEIVDLSPKHEAAYFVCLEDWSDDIKEAGRHKEVWCRAMADKGLRVKIALAEDRPVGMIQVVPIEHAPVEGQGLDFIQCVWVHAYKNRGVGNQQRKGIGRALLRAAGDDARARGAKGIAAWGVMLPFYMRASWFKKHGYTKADKNGISILLWKPFAADAVPPKWIKEQKRPGKKPDAITVTAFKNGWCPAMNMVFERAKRASKEFGEAVEFQAVETFDRPTFLEWGISDALFVDGKPVRTGPPPSYEKIRKTIARRIKARRS